MSYIIQITHLAALKDPLDHDSSTIVESELTGHNILYLVYVLFRFAGRYAFHFWGFIDGIDFKFSTACAPCALSVCIKQASSSDFTVRLQRGNFYLLNTTKERITAVQLYGTHGA